MALLRELMTGHPKIIKFLFNKINIPAFFSILALTLSDLRLELALLLGEC